MAEDKLTGAVLRVATYNVHDCIGRDGVHAPERIAEIIARWSADVVALQEITLDHAGDVVTLLERTAGMRAVDGTLFERGVGRYGNLLLCRDPVAVQSLHDISFTGREPRGLIEVVIGADLSSYRVYATHLGLASRERKQQLSTIAGVLSNSSGPAILVGDFNVWLGSSAFESLRRVGFTSISISSFPTWSRPFLPLDRIFLREPARITASWRDSGRLTRVASDHFPILADIEIDHGGVSAQQRSLTKPML